MTHPSQAPGDWAGVLEEIRRTIEAALATTVAPEETESDGKPNLPSWPGLAEAADQVARLGELAEAACSRQVEPASELAEGEDRLRRWLTDAETARRRLAEWASQSLG
jgi:hypothetical protein